MRSWPTLAGALALAGCGIPHPVLDEGRIREATEAHFGSPLAPIEIGPVVLSGDHAIADWTQGDFGGRALFERGSHGWMLLLCSGDSIRRAENLKRAGLPDFNAGWIADQPATAEARLPPARLARMKRFTGTARDHENYLKTLGGKMKNLTFAARPNRTAASIIALVIAASPAHAQEARSPDASASGWTPDIVVSGQRDGYAEPGSLAATKTDTPLIQVPQSVQVLTGALLREQDRRQLGEALANVSGVVGNRPEEGLIVGPLVRGFLAEIYQDGVPMFGAFSAVNDPASLVGFRRIDVLKGPTATLYGGGVGSPLGGLINLESERPGDTLTGYAAIRGGSFATFNPYGELNVPVTAGISARVAGEYQSNDQWVDRVEGKRVFVQPSMAFQLGARTDLLVQGQYGRREQLEYSGLPAAQALAGEVDRNAFPGAPNGQPRSTTTNRMVTGTLRHGFGDDVRLTVTARYHESRVPQFGTFVFPDMYPADRETPTRYPLLALNMLSHFEEATFDAHLSARTDLLGGSHNLLAGASYDHTDFYSDMAFAGVPVGSIDLANPAYDRSFGSILPPGLLQTDRYETLAIYAQDQADHGRLHLTGSLRYTRLRFREDQQATDETYHRVTPRIGATFDLVAGVALYAGYSTAFRGAFGLMTRFPPRPETSRNVEGGIKLAASAIGLSGTLAIYEQRRDNVATPDPDPAFPFFSIQTGQQRSRGIEADVIWEPRPAFSMIANYAYTDAEVTQDTNATLVGDRLQRVPRHRGRVAARYRFLDGVAQGLSLGAGVTAFSAREITLPNSVSVPGYAAIDAQAAYDIGRFTLQVSAVNLGGSRAFETYQYFAFPVVMPTQPRSAFVTLKVRI